MSWLLTLRRLINFWVLASAAAIGIGLLCLLVLFLSAIRPEQAPSSPATAVLYVIPYLSPTAPPATPTISPTLVDSEGSIPPPPPPGEFAIGASVQVSGTGGDGLRLRSQPGLQGEVKFLGLEGEIFTVDDGPSLMDGYTWWFIIAPYDETVRGWAVSNYLKAVQNP
jgi:hypothetical protein